MKEVTLITTFKKHEKMIIQNNGMIGKLVDDAQQMQEMIAGFLGIMRKLPGYDKAIKELAKEHEEKLVKQAEEELAAAKELCDPETCEGCIACKPVLPKEEPKVLDLGKDPRNE